MINKIAHVSIAILSLLLFGCGDNASTQQKKQTYNVTATTLSKTLRFTGTIEPLNENSVASTMDATIEKMHSRYGTYVKKGTTLYTLNSPTLQKQFNETLTDFLKAKDSFNIALSKFEGTKDLWDAGLIAKNNYLSEKSNLSNAHITLMRSERNLTELLDKMEDTNPSDLANLSFASIDKVQHVLNTNHNLINIKAPSDGILLQPLHNDDKASRINIGATVKTGQTLAVVGNLKGVRIEIDIPEIDIDKLQPGMDATISNVAGDKPPLQGKITSLSAQAQASGSGGLPSFTGVIEVNTLTDTQAWVKVGISATVEITIKNTNKLVIPTQAVQFKHGRSHVLVRSQDGHTTEQTITTGAVNNNQVIVEQGLHKGERIIYG